MKTQTEQQWIYAPSPKDGGTYQILMRNSIEHEWESTARATVGARNGWQSGKWQDWGNEVVAYRPIP